MYAHQLLEYFMFEYKQQTTFVSKLSGGEKRRLYLLTILMRNPNFLILDEPTNDLDLMTLQVLEEYLLNFDGCFLIVSHDRHFMDKLVEHTFTFEGNGLIRDYPGNYTDYRNAKQKEREQQSQQAAQSAKTNPKPITQAQQSDETRKAIKRLEKQLAQLEEKKTKLTASFDNPNLNPTQIADLSKQLADTNNEIEMKELEWLELME